MTLIKSLRRDLNEWDPYDIDVIWQNEMLDKCIKIVRKYIGEK